MSNPAVTKWLEEIAAAKAKAQLKTATPTSLPDASASQTVASDLKQDTFSEPITITTSKPATSVAVKSQYGIITSYNLKTRKKQLRLVLPPEPIKPGPGECCGNDCDPCVNTLYWEDLAAHRKKVKKLQEDYEAACEALESGQPSREIVQPTTKAADLEKEVEEEGTGLSIRSYLPFKVLRKRYLKESTLLIVCDVPYPKPLSTSTVQPPPLSTTTSAMTKESSTVSTHRDAIRTMFHILIRFKRGNHFQTKAFTPVDLSQPFSSSSSLLLRNQEALQDKLAFLVKLYPSPHVTSDMFRRLHEINGEDRTEVDGDERDVLYLRGPIQTSRDRQENRALTDKVFKHIHSGQESIPVKERTVMIAAGSGITPMYQVLRAIHYQHGHDEQEEREQHQGQHPSEQRPRHQELDLIYCNKTSSDIWLHQEIQEFCSARKDELSGRLEFRTRSVRVQHILSSSLATSHRESESEGQGDGNHEHERVHVGARISLELLRDTLLGEGGGGGEGRRCTSSEATREESLQEHLQILVCGPPSFNTDVSKMLDQLGYIDSDTCEIHILE